MSTEPQPAAPVGAPTPDLDTIAERIACSLWGYFQGDSAGSASAMRWFENNKHAGGPKHVIERVRNHLSHLESAALSQTVQRLQGELGNFKASEHLLHVRYMRIREMVSAFDTDHGGENRFEVTEGKIRELLADRERLSAENEALRNFHKVVGDLHYGCMPFEVQKAYDAARPQHSKEDGA